MTVPPPAPVDLATARWGSGPRTALLIHGITSSAAGWWRLGPDLADLGFEVVACDLRGHGDSPGGSSYRLDDYAGDVLALRDRWDLALGHSLGGAVAMTCLRTRPAWSDRLVLEDPWLVAQDPEVSLESVLAIYDGPVTSERLAAEQPSWRPEDVAAKVAALERCEPGVVIATIREGLPWDLRPEVAALEIPTLLLGADPALDPLVPPGMGEAIAATSEHVEFRVVVGGSHSMHRDAYPALWRELRAFVEKL